MLFTKNAVLGFFAVPENQNVVKSSRIIQEQHKKFGMNSIKKMHEQHKKNA